MNKEGICLYLGYAVNRDKEKQLTGLSVAGNKMQINMLKELCSKLPEKIVPISIYPVAAYPSYKSVVIHSHEEPLFNFSGNQGNNCLKAIVPFIINIPFVKNLFEIFSTYLTARKVARKYDIKQIILFNSFPPTAYTALRLKKRYGCEIISLLADLPIDDSVNTKGIKSLLLRLFQKYTKKAIQQMDKLIVLNKEAAIQFAPNIPYIVVEGAVDKSDIFPFKYIKPERKNIVFTGALQKYNGITEVVEAMKLLSETDIELDIYGKGEFEEYVKKADREYPHIHYFGVKSNEDIMRIQREAYLLINPRPSNDYIASVTFPSKMFEYMTSGTPVLATRLNGYTQEYVDNLYIIEDSAPQCIADTIKKVSELEDGELRRKAENAYYMIVNYKNWAIQAQRIIDFIKN